MKMISALFAVLLSAQPAIAQDADARIRSILSGPGFKAAAAFIDADHDRFVRELVSLTEIPAPPFREQERAAAYLDMLRTIGLSNVEMDAEGNVMGVRKGTGGGPMVAVLAHLDTVFPEGTDVKVKRDGTRLLAPGVGDDTASLAMVLTVVRAMDAAKLQTESDILFVGNVGEEGEGDLRGAKYLLRQGKYKDRIKRFISIDGGEQGSIVNGGLGSKRYRVTFKGPGGHSYGAFGLVSPAFAMGAAIAKVSHITVPSKPKTTFNVGVVGGGTSVNSIPVEMYMDVDMRSESPQELNRIEKSFLDIIRDAVDEENRVRSTKQGTVRADIKLIGDRPSGETSTSSFLVQTSAAAVKAFGLTPAYDIASTDSNIPISMGIPAVTIGHGRGGRAHALEEWFDVDKKTNVQAAQVILAVVLGASGGR